MGAVQADSSRVFQKAVPILFFRAPYAFFFEFSRSGGYVWGDMWNTRVATGGSGVVLHVNFHRTVSLACTECRLGHFLLVLWILLVFSIIVPSSRFFVGGSKSIVPRRLFRMNFDCASVLVSETSDGFFNQFSCLPTTFGVPPRVHTISRPCVRQLAQRV